MASITDDGNSKYRIQFDAPTGKRPCIRVRGPRSVAESYERHIENLCACHNNPDSLPPDTLKWALALKPKVYGKLVTAGLLPERNPTASTTRTLGVFLEEYFQSMTCKPGTKTAYGQHRRCLLEYFGADRGIRTITPKDADQYAAWLGSHEFSEKTKTAQKLAAATASRRLLGARHAFNRAVRWHYIEENPFAGIKAGRQVNDARKVYVPAADVEKVLDGATDDEWRLTIALSRYGGWRCPSETLGLKWTDVDWEKGRILVHSPKTEHHVGV